MSEVCFFSSLAPNGWRYGVGLPCRNFHFTTAVNGKLHYTACCVSGAGKFAQSPIESTIVVIYFSAGWQKSKKNLKIIKKSENNSENVW